MYHQRISVIMIFSAVCGLSVNIPHRYHFISELKTWSEAQSYCKQNYTGLATINNMQEMNSLSFTLKGTSDGVAWIGLRISSTKQWQWSLADGTVYNNSYSNWATGEPNNSGFNEYCAAMYKNSGQWLDESCEKQHQFVCYEDQLILIKQNLTWKESLRYCRKKYMDLVSVDSEEVQSWVLEVVQNTSTAHVWLGLRHTCTLGFWYWVKGESLCYHNLAPGNGTGEEDCRNVERTGAVQSGGEQKWVSLPETQTLNFICTTY